MNKKGFTLIELLAVIVILAIIALIAVPIVLNMISQARRSAARSAALGYIDAIEYNNGFANIESDAEISGYTAVTSGDVSTITSTLGSHLKGKAPTSGSVVIAANGKVESATDLCFNGYAVQYDGKDATVEGSCSSSSSNNNQQQNIPNPVSFGTDSWETIAANTTSSVYKPGDTKTITMDIDNNGEPENYIIRIVNTSTPAECSTTNFSKTSCGFVIEFLDIISMKRMNPKGNSLVNGNWVKGGWEYSELRNYLNNEFYDLMPSDLKNKIIETKVFSGHGPDDSNNFETTDKIYIMDLKEIYGASASDLGNNIQAFERQLDYYAEQQALNGNNNAAIKKYNGSASTWWLRSATTNNNTNFSTVSSIGFQNADFANNAHGVVIAFRIGNTQ